MALSSTSDSLSSERLGESDTNLLNSEVRSDTIVLVGALLDGNPTSMISSTSPNPETVEIPTLADTSSPDTRQNENEERQRATTTEEQPSWGQHPSEWSTEAVLRLFKFHKLDELYDLLFAPSEIKNGKALAKIAEFKQKNYAYYKIQYTSCFKFSSNQNNLSKDFDRFGQLLDTYFTVDKYTHRFDVAFSFPGDVRNRVSQIAEKLSRKLNQTDGKQRIFYDMYHKAELARPNLDLYLQRIYRYQTRLIVVFMCDEYSRKEWCGLEARAIRDLMKTHQSDRIMLLTVDGKTIDGIFSIDGYIDISNETDDDVADAIYSRLLALGDPLPQTQTLIQSPPPPPPIAESMMSKLIAVSKNAYHPLVPWFMVAALSLYIVGPKLGR